MAVTKIVIGATKYKRLVDVAGRELGLEEELHAVGQRLAQAEQADLRQRNAHPVRPQPVLHPGRDPALDQHQVGRGRHQPGQITRTIFSRASMTMGSMAVVSGQRFE